MSTSVKWKLDVFDGEGNVTASIIARPNHPPFLIGDPTDLAHAAAEVRGIARFATDPHAIGRAAYTAWREHIIAMQTAAGAAHISAPMTWEDRLADADPASRQIIDRWIAIGHAAMNCEPTLN